MIQVAGKRLDGQARRGGGVFTIGPAHCLGGVRGRDQGFVRWWQLRIRAHALAHSQPGRFAAGGEGEGERDDEGVAHGIASWKKPQCIPLTGKLR